MSEKDQLWIEGAQDYIKHATKLQEDFKDVSAGTTASNPPVTVHAAPISKSPSARSINRLFPDESTFMIAVHSKDCFSAGKPSSGPPSSSQPPFFLNAGPPTTPPAAQLNNPFTGYPGPSEAAKPFAAFNFPTSAPGSALQPLCESVLTQRQLNGKLCIPTTEDGLQVLQTLVKMPSLAGPALLGHLPSMPME